jgi:tRNA G46 methylase TrmB
MAETSAAVHDAALLDVILPFVSDLPERLKAGIDVADVGCGSGHAINLMAQAFPASRFTGTTSPRAPSVPPAARPNGWG